MVAAFNLFLCILLISVQTEIFLVDDMIYMYALSLCFNATCALHYDRRCNFNQELESRTPHVQCMSLNTCNLCLQTKPIFKFSLLRFFVEYPLLNWNLFSPHLSNIVLVFLKENQRIWYFFLLVLLNLSNRLTYVLSQYDLELSLTPRHLAQYTVLDPHRPERSFYEWTFAGCVNPVTDNGFVYSR